jgi:hypothetical protein
VADEPAVTDEDRALRDRFQDALIEALTKATAAFSDESLNPAWEFDEMVHLAIENAKRRGAPKDELAWRFSTTLADVFGKGPRSRTLVGDLLGTGALRAASAASGMPEESCSSALRAALEQVFGARWVADGLKEPTEEGGQT